MGAAVMLEGVKSPLQRASLARLTAALVCVLAAAVGMLVATPTPAMAATYVYDTVSYVYDAPARLSSSDTVATDARGSPSGPGATSRETFVSVARDVVAANTVPLTEVGIGGVMDDVVSGSQFLQSSRTLTQYQRAGGFGRANADFNRLTQGVEVVPRGNGVRTATLSNGTRVNVRPTSSGGAPTLEVSTPGSPNIKVRY